KKKNDATTADDVDPTQTDESSPTNFDTIASTSASQCEELTPSSGVDDNVLDINTVSFDEYMEGEDFIPEKILIDHLDIINEINSDDN
ncbi:10841_t:CDS:2, partial [Entrophospora sp. SA101]